MGFYTFTRLSQRRQTEGFCYSGCVISHEGMTQFKSVCSIINMPLNLQLLLFVFCEYCFFFFSHAHVLKL